MLISEQVLELTGDARHHHIPGSPVIYRHGWKKVTAAYAPPLVEQIYRLPSQDRYRYEELGKLPPLLRQQASAPMSDPVAPPGSELAETRRLLSMWTRSFRYSNTTQGDPQDAEFINELHRMLTDRTPPRVCGPGCQDAHAFMGLVDMHSHPVSTEMARGISLKQEDVTRLFPPGGHTDLPVASWTKRPDVAVEYAKARPARGGKVHVVLHTPPGAMGMELTPLEKGGGSWLALQAQQDEVLTGGRFPVRSVEHDGVMYHVYLGHQEDYRAQ